MKKILFILLFSLILLTGCVTPGEQNQNPVTAELTLIAPSGTPSLGLATYIKENMERSEIVAGSDPLVSAFTNATHDIIVAPVNLGAKLYKANGNYIHYRTFVWGNTYIASKSPLSNIQDLEGKAITAFGQSSTPGIVLKAILKHYNINVEVTYVDDVATANSLLMSGQAEIILTAEPSLSKINANGSLSVIDLQAVWADMTNSTSYPQAAIFVKKSVYLDTNKKAALLKLDEAIGLTNDANLVASAAVEIDTTFNKLGVEVLKRAIPNCHYGLVDNEKDPIETYFNILSDLGLSAMYGGTLPDEGFYAGNN